MSKMNKAIALLMVLAAVLLVACEQPHTKRQDSPADSLINAAYQVRNYDSIVAVANRCQQEGTLSALKAYYWRGYAYSRQRKMRMAEMEWKNAMAQNVKTDEDLDYYAQSANRLAGLLYLATEYGEAIQVAQKAIDLLREKHHTANNDYSNLLTFVGCCELKLSRPDDAADKFAQAWEQYRNTTKASRDIDSHTSAIVGIVTIVDAYLQTSHYDEAYTWTARMDSLLEQCRQLPGVRNEYIDKQWARICLYRASALEGQGNKTEAAQAYQQAMQTEYAKTNDGKIEAAHYLMTAHRWSEAADNYNAMNEQIDKYGFKLTMDIIYTYLVPKFFANAQAHRKDSALAMAIEIYHALDSAFVWKKRDDAAELAAIYETQQKDRELMEERKNLSEQRFTMVHTTFILIILGFCLFIYFHKRSDSRLETAYKHLERVKVRAEESSRMKSDFIQQISHEIRTPLNILSGFTQLITTPGTEYDEATLSDMRRQITVNTDRIAGLVNKMLELSEAKNQAARERNDKVPALQIAAEAINASSINDAGHLTFDMKATPEAEQTTLQTNLQAAVRALTLILDNARKFTAPAESIQHEKSNDHLQKVVLRMTVAAGRLFFSVEDTGIGIPHKDAERIFDEFVQLDEYYDGTGIGLTVARSLARSIGGDIILDTAYIGGSRFVMTLPLTTQNK